MLHKQYKQLWAVSKFGQVGNRTKTETFEVSLSRVSDCSVLDSAAVVHRQLSAGLLPSQRNE